MNTAPAPADTDPNTRMDRLSEIEIKLAYLDDLVDALNRTVFRQQQQLDLLTQAMADLRKQMPSAGSGTDSRDEIPPHY
ncbi:SlyX family protein [Burkholderiales bacterium GJ-E10]|nr:SlyX family protein [Burkholderiales bacterium GJ-E10]